MDVYTSIHTLKTESLYSSEASVRSASMIGVINFECHDRCVAVNAMESCANDRLHGIHSFVYKR